MGFTYTLCYCVDKKKCKGHQEVKPKIVDTEHWQEIRRNYNEYLTEEICVPGAHGAAAVPESLIGYLEVFMAGIKGCRTVDDGDASQCLSALCNMFSALAGISSAANGILSDNVTTLSALPLTTRPIDFGRADDDQDFFIQTSAVLANAFHRAVHELIESKKLQSTTHIFHHAGIVADCLGEMYRLSIEAGGHVSTEKFLPEGHSHYELLRRRQERDGIPHDSPLKT